MSINGAMNTQDSTLLRFICDGTVVTNSPYTYAGGGIYYTPGFVTGSSTYEGVWINSGGGTTGFRSLVNIFGTTTSGQLRAFYQSSTLTNGGSDSVVQGVKWNQVPFTTFSGIQIYGTAGQSTVGTLTYKIWGWVNA